MILGCGLTDQYLWNRKWRPMKHLSQSMPPWGCCGEIGNVVWFGRRTKHFNSDSCTCLFHEHSTTSKCIWYWMISDIGWSDHDGTRTNRKGICPPCIQTVHPQLLAQLPAVPKGLCPPRPQNKSTKLGGAAVYPWLTADQFFKDPFAFNTWFDHMQPFLTNVWMRVNVAAWWQVGILGVLAMVA